MAGYKTGWGSPITFAWEYESCSTKIYDYYRPKSFPEQKWLDKKKEAVIGNDPRNKYAQYLFGLVECPFDISLLGHVGITHKKGDKKAREDCRSFEYFVKMKSCDKTFLPEHLHTEDITKLQWEVNHPSYEEDLNAHFWQLKWLLDTFASGGAAQAMSRSSGIQMHLAFKRPSNEQHMRQVLGLVWILNNRRFLTNVGASNGVPSRGVLNRHMGALTKQVTANIEKCLSGVKDALQTQLYEDGSYAGPEKFMTVGFRNSYKTKGVFGSKHDPSLIGLEFRSGFSTAILEKLIPKVCEILNEIGSPNSCRWDLDKLSCYGVSASGGLVAGHQTLELPHVSDDIRKYFKSVALAMTTPKNGTKDVYPITRQNLPYMAASKNYAPILDRWSVGLVKWESESNLIPMADYNKIQFARVKLQAKILEIRNIFPSPDDTNCDTISNKIAKELTAWEQETKICEYFDLERLVGQSKILLFDDQELPRVNPEQ